MSIKSKTINHERRIRRLAKKKGYYLSKSRWYYYGPDYCLSTLWDNMAVMYDNNSHHPTLNEIEEYLHEKPDWK